MTEERSREIGKWLLKHEKNSLIVYENQMDIAKGDFAPSASEIVRYFHQDVLTMNGDWDIFDEIKYLYKILGLCKNREIDTYIKDLEGKDKEKRILVFMLLETLRGHEFVESENELDSTYLTEKGQIFFEALAVECGDDEEWFMPEKEEGCKNETSAVSPRKGSEIRQNVRRVSLLRCVFTRPVGNEPL